MSDEDLPDYKHPPVVETILGVQFEPLPKLTNAHLGVFWKTLGEDWESVSDAQTIEPQFERFGDSGNWRRLGIQFRMTQNVEIRLRIQNRDDSRMIQLQNGRLHFNWLGRGGDEYPRYPEVNEGFFSSYKALSDFLQQQNLGELQLNQWEVTYINHIPKGTVWKVPADWRFFQPLLRSPDIGIPVESFAGEWHYVIPPDLGRLHVQFRHGRRDESDPEELIVLTLTARGPLEGDEADVKKLIDGLALGRRTIVRSFRALMSDEANSFWGLKRGNI